MQFDKAYFLERFSALDTTVLRLKQGGDLAPEALAAIEEILLQRESDPAYFAHDVVEVPAETPQDVDLEASYSCVPTEIVARYWSLQEAEIVRGLLESEGIPAILADAYLIPLNNFLGVVFGGIKVKVPVACVQSAHQLISRLEAGEYALEDAIDEQEKAKLSRDQALASSGISKQICAGEVIPVCRNPDVAAALGWIFTPFFSQFIHFQNWQRLGNKTKARQTLLWMLVCGVIFVAWLWLVSPLLLDWLSILLLLVWYFASGRKQSKLLVELLGGRYQRKTWITPLVSMIILLSFLFWCRQALLMPE